MTVPLSVSIISRTRMSGRILPMWMTVSIVSALPLASLPLMEAEKDGLPPCQMRKEWSTKPWCSQKEGSPGEAETSDMTAPMPLWP